MRNSSTEVHSIVNILDPNGFQFIGNFQQYAKDGRIAGFQSLSSFYEFHNSQNTNNSKSWAWLSYSIDKEMIENRLLPRLMNILGIRGFNDLISQELLDFNFGSLIRLINGRTDYYLDSIHDSLQTDMTNLLEQSQSDHYLMKPDFEFIVIPNESLSEDSQASVVIKVHKSIISCRSETFKAMLSSKLNESRSNRVIIPNFKPTVFLAFVLYLYTGRDLM